MTSLSLFLFVCLSVSLLCLSVCLSVSLCVSLCFSVSVSLFDNRFALCLALWVKSRIRLGGWGGGGVVAWRTDAPDTLFMKGVGLFLSLSLSDCDFVLINSVFVFVFNLLCVQISPVLYF